MARIKTVFIAHPIAGDIKGNTKRVLAICEQIHSETIIPVAPYLVSLQYLNDDAVEDRELGILANLECFKRRYIDELWLFGSRISIGMEEEVRLAVKLGIIIKAKTEATRRELIKLLKNDVEIRKDLKEREINRWRADYGVY